LFRGDWTLTSDAGRGLAATIPTEIAAKNIRRTRIDIAYNFFMLTIPAYSYLLMLIS